MKNQYQKYYQSTPSSRLKLRRIIHMGQESLLTYTTKATLFVILRVFLESFVIRTMCLLPSVVTMYFPKHF